MSALAPLGSAVVPLPGRQARPVLPPVPNVADAAPRRSEASLEERQRAGDLRVCTTAAFRERVQAVGLAQAHAETDVVVAGQAEFCDQGSLHLGLGPTDPPIRLRDPQLDGIAAQAGAGGELVLPISSEIGRAHV